MIILSVINSYTIGILIAAAIIFFGLGLLFKMGLIAKQRKRILRLEDEMLANHSTILSLEKKMTELQQEKDDLTKTVGKSPNLKIS